MAQLAEINGFLEKCLVNMVVIDSYSNLGRVIALISFNKLFTL